DAERHVRAVRVQRLVEAETDLRRRLAEFVQGDLGRLRVARADLEATVPRATDLGVPEQLRGRRPVRRREGAGARRLQALAALIEQPDVAPVVTLDDLHHVLPPRPEPAVVEGIAER